MLFATGLGASKNPSLVPSGHCIAQVHTILLGFTVSLLISDLFIFSIHNLLTRSRSSSVEQEKVLNPVTQNTQPQPPPHQRPPPPRHTVSEGGSHSRFCQSDSTPAFPQQPVMPVASLVVNLNQGRNLAENRNVADRPSERNRFVATSPLPPPPAPKSVCNCFDVPCLCTVVPLSCIVTRGQIHEGPPKFR